MKDEETLFWPRTRWAVREGVMFAMRQAILLLVAFVPALVCANEPKEIPETLVALIPDGWGYKTHIGDLSEDKLPDVVVEAFDATGSEQLLLVALQGKWGDYHVQVNSRMALGYPDPMYAVHSIFAKIVNNKVEITSSSSGSRGSERFYFVYDGSGFLLSKYAVITGGTRCNLEVTTGYRWTERVSDERIYLKEFSVQKFKAKFERKYRNNLRKDLDPDLRKQYGALLRLYKARDNVGLKRRVDAAIIAYGEPVNEADARTKCEPETYLDRYLFLDDPKKSVVSNDIAFFLEQSGHYEEAIYLLSRVLKQYPERTVAYINLGDSYWGKRNYKKARKAYRTYSERMRELGKGRRIPGRVMRRLGREAGNR